MAFLDIFILMLPIIIPVILGFLFTQLKIVKPQAAHHLLRYVLYLSFPGVIIGSLSNEHLSQLIEPRFTFATIFITLFSFFFTFLTYKLIFRKSNPETAVASLCTSFLSAGIVGLPIMVHVMGAKNSIVPIILNTLYALLTVVPITIFIVNSKKSKHGNMKILEKTAKDIITNPLVISTLIGVVIVVLGIHLPNWMELTLQKLGQAAIPTALVALGISIEFSSIRKNFKAILSLTIIKMVIFPIIAFLVAKMFNIPTISAVAFVILLALPTAKSVPAIAEEYNTYVEEAVGTVTLTTALTLIVIPIVLFFANKFWPGIITF